MKNLSLYLLSGLFYFMPCISKGQFHFDDSSFAKTDTNFYAIAFRKNDRPGRLNDF